MFKTSRKYWLIIAVAIALMAGSVDRSLATPLTISNSGFDAIALSDGGVSLGIQGWSGTGTYGTRNPLSTTFDADYGGGNVAWVNSGYIYQDISLLQLDDPTLGYLNAGHLYTLTVDVGYQTLTSCSVCTSFGYTIELLSGETSLSPDTYLAPAVTAGEWGTASLTYLAASNGGPLKIRLGTSGRRTHFDNVRLTNNNVAVPEPATLVLLGSGLLGVALFGKKKFKA